MSRRSYDAGKNYFALYIGAWVKFRPPRTAHWSVGRVLRADSDNFTQFEYVGGNVGWRSTRDYEIKEVVISAVEASSPNS